MDSAIQLLDQKLVEYQELKSKAVVRRTQAQEALNVAEQEIQLYASREVEYLTALQALKGITDKQRKDRDEAEALAEKQRLADEAAALFELPTPSPKDPKNPKEGK